MYVPDLQGIRPFPDYALCEADRLIMGWIGEPRIWVRFTFKQLTQDAFRREVGRIERAIEGRGARRRMGKGDGELPSQRPLLEQLDGNRRYLEEQVAIRATDIAILTVINPELNAVLDVLGWKGAAPEKLPSGTNYWSGCLYSQRDQRNHRVVLASIGYAGNIEAASMASELIANFAPKVLFLTGIGAGIRGKVKIGSVIISDQVYYYEPVADRKDSARERIEPRPRMNRVSHSLMQDVNAYTPDPDVLNQLFLQAKGDYPKPPAGMEADYENHVADEIAFGRGDIAAGERLLRNPAVLEALYKDQNGKIDGGEMEAAGLATIGDRHATDWLVVRGISDFGDEFKSDEFHLFAARAAAVVLVNFICTALSLDHAKQGAGDRCPTTGTPQLTKSERDAPAWEGIEWEGAFIAYSGPLAGLPESEPEHHDRRAVEALQAAGYEYRCVSERRVSQRKAEGFRYAYETDKQTWKRKLKFGEEMGSLMIRPAKQG
jgi:nucleoside phosphorylase